MELLLFKPNRVLKENYHSYNGYYGWQSSTKRLDVLDPYEFVKLQNEIDPVKTKTLYLDKVNSDGTKETVPLDYYKNIEGINWEEQIMRTAPMQNHHLSLLGGTKLSKYNASFSYLNQKVLLSTLDLRGDKHVLVMKEK